MDFSELNKISYNKFSADLYDKTTGNRKPLCGTLELTFRCNYNCVHCYVNLPANDKDARSKELSFEESCNVIDDIVEQGCLWLLITGGETLLRRDFLDVYTYAKKKGLLITVFTNGALLTQRIADYFTEWRPFSVEITLYGGTKEIYDKVTGIPGSYEKCLRGIHLLLERNIPLKLKTVALTLNKHEIKAMKQLAEDLGVEFKFDPVINPRIDCSHTPCEVRLSPEEVVELDLVDEERSQGWKTVIQDIENDSGLTRMDFLYNCGAGINNFVVSPYGELEMCMISRHHEFNVREGSFENGFYEFFAGLRNLKRTRPTKCTSCQLKTMCSTCPGTSELESGGDREKPVEWLCDITHLRAKTFGSDQFNESSEEKLLTINFG